MAGILNVDLDVDGMAHGLPTRVNVTAREIHEALKPSLTAIADHVRDVLSELGSPLVADVTEPGPRHAGRRRRPFERPGAVPAAGSEPVRRLAPGFRACGRRAGDAAQDTGLRKALLTAPSTAVVPQMQSTRTIDCGLSTVLGILALLLAWQAAGPFLPKTPAVDRTLTAWLSGLDDGQSLYHAADPDAGRARPCPEAFAGPGA